MSALKTTAEKLAHMFGTERSLPICQEEKESVLLCYKQNSGESLKCSDAVKNFSRCVHSTRMVRFLHSKDIIFFKDSTIAFVYRLHTNLD